MTAVHRAPDDYPGGKGGDVLTVELTVLGIPCLGLNGGPTFRHSEAFDLDVVHRRSPDWRAAANGLDHQLPQLDENHYLDVFAQRKPRGRN